MGKIRQVTLLFVSAFLIVVSSTLSHAATILVATGPDAGHSPVVRVTVEGQNGNDTISFMAYQKNFLGGVQVATGDANSDKIRDIIVGTGAGAGPHVKAFRAIDQLVLHDFLAYEPHFLGGVFVAGAPAGG